MALTKEYEYDCEIRGPYKAVQVRKSTVIKDDGVEISRNYHRHVLQCRTKTGDTWGDTDISGEDVVKGAVAVLHIERVLHQPLISRRSGPIYRVALHLTTSCCGGADLD